MLPEEYMSVVALVLAWNYLGQGVQAHAKLRQTCLDLKLVPVGHIYFELDRKQLSVEVDPVPMSRLRGNGRFDLQI